MGADDRRRGAGNRAGRFVDGRSAESPLLVSQFDRAAAAIRRLPPILRFQPGHPDRNRDGQYGLGQLRRLWLLFDSLHGVGVEQAVRRELIQRRILSARAGQGSPDAMVTQPVELRCISTSANNARYQSELLSRL